MTPDISCIFDGNRLIYVVLIACFEPRKRDSGASRKKNNGTWNCTPLLHFKLLWRESEGKKEEVLFISLNVECNTIFYVWHLIFTEMISSIQSRAVPLAHCFPMYKHYLILSQSLKCRLSHLQSDHCNNSQVYVCLFPVTFHVYA